MHCSFCIIVKNSPLPPIHEELQNMDSSSIRHFMLCGAHSLALGLCSLCCLPSMGDIIWRGRCLLIYFCKVMVLHMFPHHELRTSDVQRSTYSSFLHANSSTKIPGCRRKYNKNNILEEVQQKQCKEYFLKWYLSFLNSSLCAVTGMKCTELFSGGKKVIDIEVWIAV